MRRHHKYVRGERNADLAHLTATGSVLNSLRALVSPVAAEFRAMGIDGFTRLLLPKWMINIGFNLCSAVQRGTGPPDGPLLDQLGRIP